MIKFKACPKCHGDLYLKEDQYGKFFDCLQCGNVIEVPVSLPKVKVAPQPLVEVGERRAA